VENKAQQERIPLGSHFEQFVNLIEQYNLLMGGEDAGETEE
jgi:hypothetical protein